HGLADPQDIVAVRDTHSPFPIEEVYVRERAKNEIVLELVIVADVDTTDDGASLLVVEEGKIRCGNSVLISQIEALVPVFDSQRCGLCSRRFTDSGGGAWQCERGGTRVGRRCMRKCKEVEIIAFRGCARTARVCRDSRYPGEFRPPEPAHLSA